MSRHIASWCLAALVASGCDDDGSAASVDAATQRSDAGPVGPPPAAACEAAAGGGSLEVAAPTLGSTPEILGARAGVVLGWHRDGTVVFRAEVEGRVWGGLVVADLLPGRPGLEVAAAARGRLYAWAADATPLPGFPVQWTDELRALAAGDLDGDGTLELVVVSTLVAGGDVAHAFHADGSPVAGWPPNAVGSGCDDLCFVTGGFDQTLAVGDLGGDGASEVFVPQDNAYLSLHRGDGQMMPAAPEFEGRSVFAGIRFLLDLALARQGFAPDEEAADQGHFTNSAPAIADIDGDGTPELIVVGSVQNVSQSDRERGVALWLLRPDGTRAPGWESPYRAPEHLAGLRDFPGTNIVALTNQVTVADLDPDRPGLEMLFAGFDGRIHCVDARAQPVWTHRYTDAATVLTAGVAVADLSGDGRPEVVFATYSTDAAAAELVVLGANGAPLHAVSLPERGSMAVPTIADTDGDGSVEIVVALKDSVDRERQVLVFDVPGAEANCLLWPTGRGNLWRSGWVR